MVAAVSAPAKYATASFCGRSVYSSTLNRIDLLATDLGDSVPFRMQFIGALRIVRYSVVVRSALGGFRRLSCSNNCI